MVACLFPIVFLLSSKPSEKTIAFDFVLDGVKRDLASMDTPEYLCLHLARFQEGEVTKLTGYRELIILHHCSRI